ncbi:hypothetical protein Leryth_023857 [Lithospermum erythrorhizon]|nr:hypothetical protein Leryth_023857 [Lithospermum erythrorhizon]
MIKIIAFDIETEEYRVVPKPICDETPISETFHVDVCGGSLCCHCSYKSSSFEVHIWVMKEYGVESSWTKLMIVSHSTSLRYKIDRIRPLAYSMWNIG